MNGPGRFSLSNKSERYSVSLSPASFGNNTARCKGCYDETTSGRPVGAPPPVPAPPPPKTFRPKTYTISKLPNKAPSRSNLLAGEIPKRLSFNESRLSFLPERDPDEDKSSRFVRYNEGTGTSFGLHLLRKSSPMVGQNLHKKFKFKRDSVVEPQVFTEYKERLVVKRPAFFDNLNNAFEDQACVKKGKMGSFKVRRLTKDQIKDGLLYLQATNSPLKKHLTPSERNITKKAEIVDTCGRRTHHPLVKAREQCKRLCEAPSMTRELDELYKEYMERCAPGKEKSEECRLLHHAPPPVRREPRRSILKKSTGEAEHEGVRVGEGEERPKRKSRKSSLRPPGVRFEKNVEMISKIPKINSLEEAMEDQVGKLKMQRQIRNTMGPVGHIPLIPPITILKGETYPLHVKDPSRFGMGQGQGQVEPHFLRLVDEDKHEARKARQELARLYFTQEATKIVAGSKIPTLGDRSPLTQKIDTRVKKPDLPHFFMDRLAADMEDEMNRKRLDKIRKIKREMDAYDDEVFRRAEDPTMDPCDTCPTHFDPTEVQPTEKSLLNLKLKMEIKRRQKERDFQATVERSRCRKAYFRVKILSSDFQNVIEEELKEFAVSREPQSLSWEEEEMRKELEGVIEKCKELEKRRNLYCREHLKFSPGKTLMFCKDIMDVLFTVAAQIKEYKALMGREPTEEMSIEWRNNLFAWMEDPRCETAEKAATSLDVAQDVANVLVEVAMNKVDYKVVNEEEALPSLVQHWFDNYFAAWFKYPECNLEEFTEGSVTQTRQIINSCIDSMLEVAVKSSEYKAENGFEPPTGLCQEWRDKFFASLQGDICDPDEEETSGQLAKNIVSVLLDCVDRYAEYHEKTGIPPTDNMCQDWREELFASIYDNECECKKRAAKEETSEEVVEVMLHMILDTVVKASQFKTTTGHEAPKCLTEEWRDEIFADLQKTVCTKDEYTNDQIITDVLEMVQEIKKKEYFIKNGNKADEATCHEWRDYYFDIMSFNLCKPSPEEEEARLADVMVRDMLDDIVDAVTKISECKEKGPDLATDSSCLLWKQRGFFDEEVKELPQEETQYQYCVRIMQETDEVIRDIIDDIVENAMNMSECLQKQRLVSAESSPESTCVAPRVFSGSLEYNIPSPPETEEEEEEGSGETREKRVTITFID